MIIFISQPSGIDRKQLIDVLFIAFFAFNVLGIIVGTSCTYVFFPTSKLTEKIM